MACSSFSGRVLLFCRQQATLTDFRTNSKRCLFGPGLSFPSSAPSSSLYFIHPFSFATCCCSSTRFHLHILPQIGCGNGNNNNGNNNNGKNNNNDNGHDGNGNNQDPLGLEGSPFSLRLLFFLFSLRVNDKKKVASTSIGALLFYVCLLGCFWHFQFFRPALATSPPATKSLLEGEVEDLVFWEVRGSRRTRIVCDSSKDTLVTCGDGLPSSVGWDVWSNLWKRSVQLFLQLMLPEGYPHSVSSDYLEYSLWRGVQGVASQISGVLATQALLYAVGLGKGAIPTAAAVNWVLKDGIGYLSKIFLSKYGRHFDVHPKGWRLFADLLENSAYGMELLTPAFSHIFVFIGAIAGAGRAAAALIQASTRSCFYAGFATQRNFAEVIAKGEAQGMVSKSLGILLGIALANCIGSSTTLALGTFSVITCIHMFCNLKSYRSIQLRTLNPYRSSLVFSEYLLTGQIPPIKEVNNEEPFFPSLPVINVKPMSKVQSHVLSSEAKDAAAEIEHRLQLGSKLSDVINTKEDAFALFDLFRNEGYMLMEKKGSFCVLLKEGCAPEDMLKSLFHVNYLYWLERNLGIECRGVVDDCRPGGRLQISLDYVKREFNHVKHDGQLVGWVTDGLVARPLPNRIRLGYEASPAR